MPSMTLPFRLVWLLALAGLAACGANAGAPPGDDQPDPAFLVATRVFDDASTTTYLHTVPSLEAGTPIDVTKALEVAGSAKLYSIPGAGWFAIGSGEKPTITKYTLED